MLGQGNSARPFVWQCWSTACSPLSSRQYGGHVQPSNSSQLGSSVGVGMLGATTTCQAGAIATPAMSLLTRGVLYVGSCSSCGCLSTCSERSTKGMRLVAWTRSCIPRPWQASSGGQSSSTCSRPLLTTRECRRIVADGPRVSQQMSCRDSGVVGRVGDGNGTRRGGSRRSE